MNNGKMSGLKAPTTKVVKPSGLPHPRSSIPTPGGSRSQSALAQSLRNAGISAASADQFANDVVDHVAGPEPTSPKTPVDDFIIGDRVWVGGTKPGKIAFIGEAQFAPGEWVGIVLDETVGKNDGSIAGVRYFQCDMKRGVFARINKISRTPETSTTPHKSTPSDVSSVSSQQRLSLSSQSNGVTTPTSLYAESKMPKSSLGMRSPAGSNCSLNRVGLGTSVNSKMNTSINSKMNTSINSKMNTSMTKPNAAALPHAGINTSLRLGDRVMVSGTKPGALRFLGTTDFSKGVWCGVELDEALGKNDGAVAGKRYFTCTPMYGLFAPIHKVSRISVTTPPLSTPRSKRSIPVTGVNLSRQRSGSQDSISSISSAASSVSRSRVKPGRIITPLSSATASTLQKALKEKDEHIEQLLKERELERSEVARAAAQVDEAESELVKSKTEFDHERDDYEETITGLRTSVADHETHNMVLQGKLDEEKRKVEDLQFEIAEESMCKDDLDSRTDNEQAIVIELQQELKLAHEKSVALQLELESLQMTVVQNKTYGVDLDRCNKRIGDLTAKLEHAEQEKRKYESQTRDQGNRNSQVMDELSTKVGKLTELEALVSERTRHSRQVEEKLTETNESLKTEEKKVQKLQNTIDSLMTQLRQKDAATMSLQSEIHDLKSQLTELKHLLEASNNKAAQLGDDNSKQERQLKEMLANTGSSNEQVCLLNERLSQRDRELEETQAALSKCIKETRKYSSELSDLRSQHQLDVDNLNLQHQTHISAMEDVGDKLQSEIDKQKSKIDRLTQQREADLAELTTAKNSEIHEMTQKLAEQDDMTIRLQKHVDSQTTTIDRLTNDLDTVQNQKKESQTSYDEITRHNGVLSETIHKLRDELITHEMVNTTLKDERAIVENKLQDLGRSHELKTKQLTVQHQAVLDKSQHSHTEQLNDVEMRLKQSQNEHTELLNDVDMKLKQSQNEHTERLSDVEMRLQQSQDQLSKKSHNLELLHKELDDIRNENISQREELLTQSERGDEMQKSVDMSQTQVKALEAQRDNCNEQLQNITRQYTEMGIQNKELQTRLDEFHQTRTRENQSQSEARVRVESALSAARSTLQERDLLVDTLNNRISNLENDNNALQGYQVTCQKLENEQFELYEKVAKLETQMSEPAAQSNMSGEPAPSHLNNDPEEEMERQVDFLNSVIADIQKKYDKAKLKIRSLENINMVNGGDSSFEAEQTHNSVAPRLFCDICDVFDEHDTEDCPLQAMSDSPPSSHHAGSRNQERPYCDNCESFLPIGEILCSRCISDDDYAKKSFVFRQFLFDSDVEYWSDPSPRISPVPPELKAKTNENQ